MTHNSEYLKKDIKKILKELNLLIVEDDLVSSKVITSVLKDFFQNVFNASDGEEGLNCFKENQCDLIVTDFSMPKMNGIEMIEKIRHINNNVPIVLLTNLDDPEMLIKAINLKVASFVPKPIEKTKLLNAIEKSAADVLIEKLLIKEKEQEIKLLKYAEKYHQAQESSAFEKELNLIKNDVEMKSFPSNKCSYLFNTFYKPMEILSGDCYSIRKINQDNIFGFIIDTMGKGLSASVTSILSIAFLNHAVDKALEKDDFMFSDTIQSYIVYIRKVLLAEELIAGSLFLLDLSSDKLKLVHFSMPSLLMLKEDGSILKVPSNNPPLTKYTYDFDISEIDISDVSKLIIYSDGLVESSVNNEDIFFSQLVSTYKENYFFNTFIDVVKDNINSFEDDVTIISINRFQADSEWESKHIIDTKLSEVENINKVFEIELLNNSCTKDDVDKACVVFSEMVMNAYEHGNLNIDYDMKSRLLNDKKYDNYILEAEQTCDLKIKINFGIYKNKIFENRFIYVIIEDEGKGFNINITERALTKVDSFNGRGIILSKTYADGVYYNIKGNKSQFFIKI